MKRLITVLLSAAMVLTMVACSSKEDQLVTKMAFPALSDPDMEGNTVTNDLFSGYDVTIVNFWNNGCGTCIEEMPDLEEMYQEFQEENINLIGVAADSGESDEQFQLATEILEKKGVTYLNISPDTEGSFYQDFVSQVTSYPTTYIVDREGNIVGAPIIGVVKNQRDTLDQRIKTIQE